MRSDVRPQTRRGGRAGTFLLGRLVVRAFASWLVFEHQADGAQLTFQDAALPSQQPKSDHPDLCPETEESGQLEHCLGKMQGG